MSARSLVRNAADPQQVKFARETIKQREDRRFNLVQQQLSTPAGREFVWETIESHGIHDLVSGPSDQVFMFLGKREEGVKMLVEVMREHPDAFLAMQQEALERTTKQTRAVDAAHTAPVPHADVTE